MDQKKHGMMEQLGRYLEMIKVAHSLFALPFAAIAFLQAMPLLFTDSVKMSVVDIAVKAVQISIAMVTMRSAAMGFNRIVDRKFDERNPRTAQRELPAGKISLRNAWLFTTLMLVLFVADAFWLNRVAGLLAPVAIFLVLGYSYTKRFTMYSHYFLGAAIGLAPSATWIALLGRIDPLPVYWSMGLGLYVAGFDILYSCQDAEFDRKHKLHSLPSRLGVGRAMLIARLTHFVSLAFLIMAAMLSHGGWILQITLLVTALLFIAQHLLVQPDNLKHINIAFFHINAWLSILLFTGLLLDTLLVQNGAL